jgi:hypothetical protein
MGNEWQNGEAPKTNQSDQDTHSTWTPLANGYLPYAPTALFYAFVGDPPRGFGLDALI